MNLLRPILATLGAVLSLAFWLYLGSLIPEGNTSQWLVDLPVLLRTAHTVSLLVVFALVAGIVWPWGRRWIFDHLSGCKGRGLPEPEFRALRRNERRILRRLRKPIGWAAPARVSISETARCSNGDIREHVRLPSVIRCELTPSGPAVVVRIARGSVPSAFTDELISAAVDAPIRVTATAPREVHLQAVTRDPLATTPAALADDAWRVPPPPDEDDWGDDWGAIDIVAEDR